MSDKKETLSSLMAAREVFLTDTADDFDTAAQVLISRNYFGFIGGSDVRITALDVRNAGIAGKAQYIIKNLNLDDIGLLISGAEQAFIRLNMQVERLTEIGGEDILYVRIPKKGT